MARGRTSILPFAAVETAVLLVLVVLVAHSRSFAEQLLFVRRAGALPELAPDEGRYILARSLIMVLSLQTCFAFRDLYRWSVITRPQLAVVRLVEATGLALIGLPLLHYVFGALDRNFELQGALARLQIHPMLVLAAAGACFLAAYGLRMRWPRWAKAGLGERVLMAGRGPAMDVLEEELRRRPDPGIELVGWLDEANGTPGQRHVLGLPGDAATIVRDTGAHRLVVAPGAGIAGDVLLAVRLEDVRVSEAGAFFEQLTGRLSLEALADPRLALGPGPGVGMPYVVLRRGLDVAMASVGLLLATPLCLLAALSIKLESRGPVLYRQERVGRNGRPFTLAKFRSMRADAEAGSGPVWAGADDPRITRVGRWLRKLRIDEIPQLWSVIRNDMSLVGPRPERPYFVADLERQIPGYGQRHVVKPGVTGWAQINYSYGNSVDDAFIKLQYDLYYVKNRSLALDVAILLRTVKVVVLQQGAV